MNDLLIMIGLFLFYVLIFFVLQIIIFRLIRIEKLFTTLTIINFIALFGALIICYNGQHLFVSYHSYLTASFGACFSGFLFGYLYAFSGPSAADRSFSAHMVILLSKSKNGAMSLSELKSRYPLEQILEKRFYEHRNVGLITIHEDEIKITPRGRLIARIYMGLIRLLRLPENF